MSRSHKKVAVTGITTSRSEKLEKVAEHRSHRVQLRSKLAAGDFDAASINNKPGGWFSKDGKTRWTGTEYEAKALRK